MLINAKKKSSPIKIIALVIVILLIALAFINPTPTIEHVEQDYTPAQN